MNEANPNQSACQNAPITPTDGSRSTLSALDAGGQSGDLAPLVDGMVETPPPRLWSRIFTMAGLVVLGITPWASAQLDPPDLPAVCPPITFIQTPSLFDMFWGTTPIRFPYQ